MKFAQEGVAPVVYPSSPGVLRTFCGKCGGSLTYTSRDRPTEIDVTLATVRHSEVELTPLNHTWMHDARPWEATAHRLPAAEGDMCGTHAPLRMGVRTWMSPKVEKGRASTIEGRGVIAIEPIANGEVVAIKGGHIVDRSTLKDLSEHLQNSEIGIADGLHLVALYDDEYEDVMLFLNHSCAPNVGLRGNTVFVAMSDVAAGTELTIDYAMIDDHDDGPMVCHCATPNCRRVVTGRDWQRKELQQRYGAYFSSYLQHKMEHDADE